MRRSCRLAGSSHVDVGAVCWECGAAVGAIIAPGAAGADAAGSVAIVRRADGAARVRSPAGSDVGRAWASETVMLAAVVLAIVAVLAIAFALLVLALLDG
jgi:hypothetical protein